MLPPVEGGSMLRLSHHSTASRRAGVVTALVATLALVGCMPATASDVRVKHTLFGMHDGTVTSSSLVEINVGAVRLWDVHVKWSDVETSPGTYDFDRLDALVTNAQAHHAEAT